MGARNRACLPAKCWESYCSHSATMARNSPQPAGGPRLVLASDLPVYHYSHSKPSGGSMAKKRTFISFDYDNDQFLKEALVGQAKNADSPFDFADHSNKEHLTGDW